MEKFMVSIFEAQELVDELREKFYYNRGFEFVNVKNALNRELFESIFASHMSPSRDTATMDGYALRCEDSYSYPLKIVRKIYAGEKNPGEIKKGEAAFIATGAFMPEGANAVLKIEDARVEGDSLYGKFLEKGTYVLKAGSDYVEGEEILKPKLVLRSNRIALLRKLGISKVKVFRRPRAAIFSTGDEISRGLMRDTNALMLQNLIKEFGGRPEFIGILRDNFEEIKKALRNVAGKYDVVITSGGVSVGERDYVVDAIRELGEIVFQKMKVRPGKPVAVGIINNKPIFALPGKPSGAFAAAEICLRRYFLGNISRPVKRCVFSNGLTLEEPEFTYMIFVNIFGDKCYPVGINGSRPGSSSAISQLASSPRSINCDGYIIASKEIKTGSVDVNLIF